MGLFSSSQRAQIDDAAAKSKLLNEPTSSKSVSGTTAQIAEITKDVQSYFSESKSVLISTEEQLNNYVDICIKNGLYSMDTETTGLDRIKDTIVGASLCTDGEPDCYIPCKHLVPIFDEPYKGQLTYEQVGKALDRLVKSKSKSVWFNADFDISMIYKDFKVDMLPSFYFDCMVAARCLKDNELDGSLKGLYNKYVLEGKGDPKRFRDFFSPALYPYCKPEVAALYAGNDAKITLEYFKYLLPFITKDDPVCKEHHLERVADLIWKVEMPMIAVCQKMHRDGIYIDRSVASPLQKRYHDRRNVMIKELQFMVQEEIDKHPGTGIRPFAKGTDFNPNSIVHKRYLLFNMMGLDDKGDQKTGKDKLREYGLPLPTMIADIGSLDTVISTFVDKLPKSAASDGRIHATFNSTGARTGRMSSDAPNLQNIPSKLKDIRHLFRAAPQKEEITTCNELDDEVIAQVGRYNIVIADGGSKQAKDLTNGDTLILQVDGSTAYAEVVSTVLLPGSPDVEIHMKWKKEVPAFEA